MESFYIHIEARTRDDGSLFVTSPNLPFFSAVVADGKIEGVLTYLKDCLEVNVGRVEDVRFVSDAKLMFKDNLPMVPAHIVAELTRDGIRTV